MGIFSFLTRRTKPKEADNNTVDYSDEVRRIIPKESRPITATPYIDGLYSDELLALYFARSYQKNQKYPGFWETRYGINDLGEVLHNLMERELLSFTTPYETLEKEPIDKLHSIARQLEIPLPENDIFLSYTIRINTSEEQLNKLFDNPFYKLTSLGQRYVDRTMFLPLIHEHGYGGLTIWSVTDLMRSKRVDLGYRDVIWGYLVQRAANFIFEDDYDNGVRAYYEMALFLIEEEKYGNAFQMLCVAILYDLQGGDKSGTVGKELIVELDKLQRRLGWSENRLERELRKEYAYLSTNGSFSDIDEDEFIQTVI